MDLSLLVFLLIVFGVAVGAYVIGIQVTHRAEKAAPIEHSSVIVIPDTLVDLVSLRATTKVLIVDNTVRHRWEMRPAWRPSDKTVSEVTRM